MERIVITGMGAVTPLGLDAKSTWRAMCEGKSAVSTIRNWDSSALKVQIAAEVRDFDPTHYFSDKKLQTLDRFSQFAQVAAAQAIAQSGVEFNGELLERTAVVIGTGVGGETTHDAQLKRLYGEQNPKLHPFTIVRLMANAPAANISITYGLQGPVFAVSSACASANHAMAQAALLLRSGCVDVAISGGTEACLTYGTLRAWEAMRVLTDDACRPFSRDRRGLVLGEGAAIFVLETLSHAKARGAVVLAELAGFGMTADGTDIVLPRQQGAAGAMQCALRDAKLAASAIGYLNAHGTGTVANDATETAAIKQVFGPDVGALKISSTKSMHGHALGAAGAIELIACIGALQDGVLPPTINYQVPDPACDLDYVPNVAQSVKVQATLSNSFAFGGLNAVIALSRFTD